jgi:hypothetical protein
MDLPRMTMQCITPSLGPKMDEFGASYEVEEMNCVSAAIHSFLDCSLFEFFTAYSSRARKVQVTKAWSDFLPVLKETAHWKSEEPKPARTVTACYWGQDTGNAFMSNSSYRGHHWFVWQNLCSYNDAKLESRDLRISDYLGLCLWDAKRLVYLGLEHMPNKYLDPCLGRPWQPRDTDIKFYNSDLLTDRWRDLFIQELIRLPGGRRRMLSNNCKRLLDCWAGRLEVNFGGWRE